MKRKKAKIPVGITILLIIVIFVLLALCVLILPYVVLHFPSDSLTNYPGTEWKCDKLGIELVVDEYGNISGNREIESGVISLDVFAHSSTTWHTNYIICVNSADETQILYLDGYYSNIEDGVLYVTIYSKKTTVDLGAFAGWLPYKFVKQ